MVVLALSTLAFADVPTPGSELSATWAAYCARFISSDGRAIDFRNGSMTSSEGQAYAMLRAVWSNDRSTFDRVWEWTNANLQGGNPGQLPAWKWGRTDNGAWGLIDKEPASDADQFMAYALIGAARRWKDPRLARAAVALLGQVWDREVDVVADHQVVLPGPWARGKPEVQLNPSYFLPFALREFAKADPAHPWANLIGDGYALLKKCRGATGLPKDWCYLDAESGRVLEPADAAHDNFGFEAFRVGWSLAADAKWHHEPRAAALLGPFLALLSRPPAPVSLPGIIGPDGSAQVPWSYPGMYGALLPAWAVRRPAAAQRAWDTQLVPLRAEHGWGDPDDYYSQNWIWFGLALWQSPGQPV